MRSSLCRLLFSPFSSSSLFSSSLVSLRPSLSHVRLFASTPLKVPSMGDSISDGSLIELLKKPGDAVKENEIIAKIETDKVAIDIRADRDGVVTAVPVKVGDNVKVGAVLMEIDGAAKSGASSSAPKPIDSAPSTASSPASASSAPSASHAAPSSSASHSHSTPGYVPKIRFVHGKGRNEDGDFPSYPVHRRSASHSAPAAAAAAKPAQASAPTKTTGGPQPTLQPDAYWAKNSREFQDANRTAALALKSLPAYYRRAPMKANMQSLIDMGGAPDYQLKQKGKPAKE
jgi:2-oxoglutarate dehydrogenase E2 component (dihydrolipoamide succinyltransferase)